MLHLMSDTDQVEHRWVEVSLCLSIHGRFNQAAPACEVQQQNKRSVQCCFGTKHQLFLGVNVWLSSLEEPMGR